MGGYLSWCADPKRVFNNLQPNAAPCLNRPFAGRQETAGMLNFLHQQRRGEEGEQYVGADVWLRVTTREEKNSKKMYVREHVSSFNSKGCNLSLNLYLMGIKLYYMGNLGVCALRFIWNPYRKHSTKPQNQPENFWVYVKYLQLFFFFNSRVASV